VSHSDGQRNHTQARVGLRHGSQVQSKCTAERTVFSLAQPNRAVVQLHQAEAAKTRSKTYEVSNHFKIHRCRD